MKGEGGKRKSAVAEAMADGGGEAETFNVQRSTSNTQLSTLNIEWGKPPLTPPRRGAGTFNVQLSTCNGLGLPRSDERSHGRRHGPVERSQTRTVTN